ncbi:MULTISPECIES: hypothetical protein [unclassified Lentimonas]|uniref:hypothetical protein n=1 Tax=unclassified Lentimonas TaxID=2630993 RepID=UPI0013224137|nr:MULTISPECIES: hypothetical protein [unclassified Lentimonas]CAA6693722.1 Unannotated [Lentimonas sp. CC10]CAA6696368.1 Unannotated [Lentimonas sp. CC19]CAA7071649.1 Unannotated [Lentimonas sp. CC11]
MDSCPLPSRSNTLPATRLQKNGTEVSQLLQVHLLCKFQRPISIKKGAWTLSSMTEPKQLTHNYGRPRPKPRKRWPDGLCFAPFSRGLPPSLASGFLAGRAPFGLRTTL